MIPATCVPCPYWSSPVPLAPVKSTDGSMRPCSALWRDTPESMTATPIPRPVACATPGSTPAHAWSAPIACVETAICDRTSVSPARCPTAGSALIASSASRVTSIDRAGLQLLRHPRPVPLRRVVHRAGAALRR